MKTAGIKYADKSATGGCTFPIGPFNPPNEEHSKLQRLVGDFRTAVENLWRARVFQESYAANEKLAPLVREIGWSHNLLILERMILCKEKNRTVVEYALHDARQPIGVATYHTVKRLPKELKGQLPAPEEIAKLLEASP